MNSFIDYLKGLSPNKIWKKLSLSINAFIFAMLAGSFFLLIGGHNPLVAYKAIVEATFSSSNFFVYTLGLSTPLIFTGLAFLLARKIGLLSLGAEGQLYLGALAGVIFAAYIPMPPILLIPFSFLAAIISGFIWGYIPALLKIKFKANEVITSLMLNYVAINFVGYMVQSHLQDPDSFILRTIKINEAAELPLLADKSLLTVAYIIAVVTAILISLMLQKTLLGYKIRSVGSNLKAAETAGINYKKVMLITMMLSGGIAAIAGWAHVLGVEHRLLPGFSPGYGFDGVSVAALAAGSPVGVIFSAFILGALKNGAMFLSRTTEIPSDFVYVIQAFVIIFVASPRLLRYLINLVKKPFEKVASVYRKMKNKGGQ